jgi:hypothetical protein
VCSRERLVRNCISLVKKAELKGKVSVCLKANNKTKPQLPQHRGRKGKHGAPCLQGPNPVFMKH